MVGSVQGLHVRGDKPSGPCPWGFWSNRCLRSRFLGWDSRGGVEADEFSWGVVCVGAWGPRRGGWVGGPDERSKLNTARQGSSGRRGEQNTAWCWQPETEREVRDGGGVNQCPRPWGPG